MEKMQNIKKLFESPTYKTYKAFDTAKAIESIFSGEQSESKMIFSDVYSEYGITLPNGEFGISEEIIDTFPEKFLLISEPYKNLKTKDIGKLAISLSALRKNQLYQNDDGITTSVELDFDCFFCGVHNNIVLKIRKDEDYIHLHRFLYNIEMKEYYQGLGQYYMGFVKSIATNFNPARGIITRVLPGAESFYLAEGFKNTKENEFVWKC